jgi:hypothetical protein
MQVEEEVTEFRSLRLAMRVSKEELRKQPNVVLLEDGGKVAKTAFLLQQKGLNQVNQTPMAQNAAFNIKSGPFLPIPRTPGGRGQYFKSIVALNGRRLVVYYDSFVCYSKSTNVLRTHAGSDDVQMVNAVRSRVLSED